MAALKVLLSILAILSLMCILFLWNPAKSSMSPTYKNASFDSYNRMDLPDPTYLVDPTDPDHMDTFDSVDTFDTFDTFDSISSSGSFGTSGSCATRKGELFPPFPPVESYRASGIDNPVIDQGTMQNAYALMNKSYTDGGTDSMSQRLILFQVKTSEMVRLVRAIQDTIINKLVGSATVCKDMHGADGLGDERRTLSFACVTDPVALKDDIIQDVYDIIYGFVKTKFHINMNEYVVYYDLNRQLDLLEAIIYPLMYSNLYTVHGVQYITADWIRVKVEQNLKIQDVLLTVFSRRNIDIEVDTDQHTY